MNKQGDISTYSVRKLAEMRC